MDEQVRRLVDKAWNKFLQTPQSQRLLIAVSGIPGSGKTTLAAKVASALVARYNEEHPATGAQTDVAIFVPMDGFHLTRAQLSAMPDPNTAHARRGAAFTFDAPGFLALVKQLRKPIVPATGTIYAPSFDHAVKDPKADDIPIAPTARIVVLEGNYLSLGTGAPEWRQAAELMDELWFVEVPMDVARKRLIARHLASGIAATEEAAGKRADENDLLNGKEIIDGRLDVQEIIQSRDDDDWSPTAQEKHD